MLETLSPPFIEKCEDPISLERGERGGGGDVIRDGDMGDPKAEEFPKESEEIWEAI